jgi:hypothetical protein
MSAAAAMAFVAVRGDPLVTVGSPQSPFSQNKQNEPAVAIDPSHANVLIAGANDNIDLEACNAGDPTSCPFTNGVGVSGVYFSFDGGASWTQPTTYQGYTARTCLGPAACAPSTPPTPAGPSNAGIGPIGTLPGYVENGLVSDGDPAVAFGPKPGADGTFSWANGSRVYYANLTANFSAVRSETTFKGFEAVAVSRLDAPATGLTPAIVADQANWKAPVIVTKQNAALFSDHEAIAVDDASSTSPFFGGVYVCSAAFRSQEISPFSLPEPIVLSSSHDGGDTWGTVQISPAVNNIVIGGRQDCQVDTDSKGNVFVFWEGIDTNTKRLAIFMNVSTNGGKSFGPQRLVTFVTDTGIFDPNQGRLTFDGLGGARDGLAPSISIANGAPTGAGATDEIVVAWENGPTPSDTHPGPNEKALVISSTNGGATWSQPVNAAPSTDRPDFVAIAISPNGQDVYVVYDNFLQPWQSTTTNPRLMQGVVRHASVGAGGALGAFSDKVRDPTGDARGSSANSLVSEFLGDYNLIAATNTFAYAVWNDSRNAADCPAVDAFRQALTTANPLPRPAPEQACLPTFGNSDIFGAAVTP